MSDESTRERGITGLDGLLLGLVGVWGVNFSVLKVGLDVVPAEVFNGARMGLAAGVFVALLAAQRALRWQRGDGRRILALGLLGHAGYQILFIEGLARTAVAHSSLLLASVPMWVAIIGVIGGWERPTRRAWLGIGLAFCGVLAVILGPSLTAPAASGGSTAGLLGDGLVLAATLCWSGYTAFSKPLLTRYSPVQLSGLSLAPALPVLLAVALYAGLTTGWGQWTPGAAGALLFGGVLSVNVCYVIWYRGVQRLGGARTAVFSNITPLVAIIAAWLWRNEPLLPVYGLGAALIAGGVLLTRFSPPSSPADATVAAEADSAVGTG